MNHKLIITKRENQILSSLLEGNELVQINVENLNTQSILGNIYLGKVKNIVKNINAAFVEIQDGIMCYLALDEAKNPIFSNSKNNTKIQVGDELIVQVSKENIKTKAPLVTTNINFTGKYVVLTHAKNNLGISNKIITEEERSRLKNIVKPFCTSDYGFIIRTNAFEIEESIIVAELERLIQLYKMIVEQGIHKTRFSIIYRAPSNYLCDIRDGYSKQIDEIITDEKELYEEIKAYLFTEQQEDLSKLRFYDDSMLSLSSLYSIETKFEKALQEKVWLKSGGSLVIQPTEALTVIDVNTGKAISGKKAVEETFFKLNLEAAKEIAKQIRLRNLSGIIIIDFIDMIEEEHKSTLLSELKKYLMKDPIKTILVDMTALNLVEITRKKVRKPLYEQIKTS